MNPQPSLFLSHGAPNMILQDIPVRAFFQTLARKLPRPDAILIMSAHFETDRPAFEVGEHPGMIYDFGGFEPELYEMTYAAPGAPVLAERAARLAADAGFQPGLTKGRGYDHGAWVPLKLIFADADIPVATMSVQPKQDGAYHLRLGQALAPLRNENVLIVGSGGATHNLRAFFAGGRAATATPDWVEIFDEWLCEKARAGDAQAVSDWTKGPHALENHPSAEHFLPFPFAMGAGGPGAKGRRLHHSYIGSISLDAYMFE